MSAITIQDLNNAKTDVDHIAEIATSALPTAADRLGHVKSTVQGAIDSIKTINNRGAWAAVTVYAGKDIVSSGGIWYFCVVAHTSSALFATDTASKWLVYQGVTSGDLSDETDPAKAAALVGYNPELAYPQGVGLDLGLLQKSSHRNLSSLSMTGYSYQFGGTMEHFLSKNAMVINADSVGQGANAGYYMDNGWAHKVKRELMKAYKTKSYGYLNVADKQGYIEAPTGAYRWYEPSTTGTVTENEFALNSIGGAQVALAATQYVKWKFNRADIYAKEIIPAQRLYRVVFNDSSGSVRVTAAGIGTTISTVVATVGTGISAVLSLPGSWNGEITVTNESGAPVVNGIVLLETEDAYCVHMIYNGGRGTDEISDDVYSKIITNADLYIHALGINDFLTPNEAAFEAKMIVIKAAIEASQITRCLIMDFGWTTPRAHYVRAGLRALARGLKNEAVLIDVPKIIANGGPELTTAVLKSAQYLFLSSDGVHPFLNGHSTIANLVLAELGLPQEVKIETTLDRRKKILDACVRKSYSFGGTDFSGLFVGWTASAGQTVTYTEGVGCVFTGNVSPAYIETMIPVNATDLWRVTIELHNTDSNGVFNVGTRSYDILGSEIVQQDAVGSLSGNLAVASLSLGAGVDWTVSFVVGGMNAAAGTDASKLEPGAAYFNLAFNINNGWTSGSLIIKSITVAPAKAERKHAPTPSNAWVKDGTYLTAQKDADGFVQLYGRVKSGASGTTAFTLPVGYRPDETTYNYMTDPNGGMLLAVAYSDGRIDIFGTGTAGWNTRVQLNGMRFPTGQALVTGN